MNGLQKDNDYGGNMYKLYEQGTVVVPLPMLMLERSSQHFKDCEKFIWDFGARYPVGEYCIALDNYNFGAIGSIQNSKSGKVAFLRKRQINYSMG